MTADSAGRPHRLRRIASVENVPSHTLLRALVSLSGAEAEGSNDRCTASHHAR